jgi:hypothetical protein
MPSAEFGSSAPSGQEADLVVRRVVEREHDRRPPFGTLDPAGDEIGGVDG